MTMGEKIKSLRLTSGMSQTELGDKIGVQTSAIYKYENGLVVNLKASTLKRLAEVLGTTPTYLMGFEDEVRPTPVPESGPLSPGRQALLDAVKDMDDDTARAVLEVVKSVKRLKDE